jgi:hypothetical protein
MPPARAGGIAIFRTANHQPTLVTGHTAAQGIAHYELWASSPARLRVARTASVNVSMSYAPW